MIPAAYCHLITQINVSKQLIIQSLYTCAWPDMETVELLAMVFEGRLSMERASVVLRLPLKLRNEFRLNLMVIILFLPKPIWFLCESIVLTTNSLLSLCFPFLDGTQELIIWPRQFFSVKIPKNSSTVFHKGAMRKTKIFKGVHLLFLSLSLAEKSTNFLNKS